MKIKFNSDVTVLDHNGEIEFSAKADEVVEVKDTSGDRWIRRGKAEIAKEKPKPAPKKKAAKSESAKADE